MSASSSFHPQGLRYYGASFCGGEVLLCHSVSAEYKGSTTGSETISGVCTRLVQRKKEEGEEEVLLAYQQNFACLTMLHQPNYQTLMLEIP
jgi:hypothetical protein